MYPRNAASPEPIAIGAVVQISDGAVQTSGCTVRIKPIGVAEGDGGGTTAYSTDGIVLYTPTQAETNYTSFILIAKKTGCIPVSITVVTTASSVPGRTMPADGSITAAVIATDAIDSDAIAANAVTEIQAGLSTLTQTQVTGGAYALNSASFAFHAGLDFTTTQKAATIAGVTTVGTTTNITNLPTMPTDWITAAGLSAGAVTEIQSGLSTLTQTQVTGGAYALNSSSFAFNASLDFTTTQKAATLARVTLVDNLTTYTGNTPQTGDSYAIVSSGVHGNAAIKGYVDDIGVAGAGLTALGDTRLANLDATVSSRSSHNAAAVVTAMGTGTFLAAIPWNSAWDAEVQSEVQDAIEVNHLDHLLAADYDPASKPGVATALFNELIGSDAGVSQFTANALELAPSAGGGTDWTADERTAIRAILGVPVSGTTPDDPTTGIMDTIRDSVATRASQASIDDFVLNSMEVY